MEDHSILKDVLAEFDRLQIIDTHEHLIPEPERIKRAVDFTTLFSHYCASNFCSAGMTDAQWDRMKAAGADPEEKWSIFSQYYPVIKHTSYARAARLAMEHFYGESDLTSFAQAQRVSDGIRQANRPGLYQTVLKDHCHFQKVVLFTNDSALPAPDYFHFVDNFDHYFYLTGSADIQKFAAAMGGSASSLDAYARLIRRLMEHKRQRGVRAVKFACAYTRSLSFAEIAAPEAERLFEKALRVGEELSRSESLALQDYFIYKTLDFCGELGLPAVFHTGMQAGNGNFLVNGNPLLLDPLFRKYPRQRFILLHAGQPWTREAAMAAKFFPNVCLDMAWTYSVSPVIAENALKLLFDLVPSNKLMGFGGDTFVVEKIYGHLMLARGIICRVLAQKAAEGEMPMEDIPAVLNDLLVNNAKRIYQLV